MAPSVLQTLGKDRIIFVTKEDHETPSNAELVADDPNDPYEEHGECGGWGRQVVARCSWPQLGVHLGQHCSQDTSASPSGGRGCALTWPSGQT